MYATILDIATHLPTRVLDNEDLALAYPEWNLNLVALRAGVVRRHVAASDETALDLGLAATKKLLERQPQLQQKLDVLIFCTQTPDYPLPSNACILHGKLDLPKTVAAFDINLACSGYGYALCVANSLICSGMARNILVVTADTYSKYIHERDRSSRVLFGDGAAVTWVSEVKEQCGILDATWGTDGQGFATFMVPAGGCRTPKNATTCMEEVDNSGNVRTAETLHMAGKEILKFTYERIPEEVCNILGRNSLSIDDINLFLFHQASGMVLDSLTQQLNLPSGKVFRNLEDIGNTVSASIPMGLHDAVTSGRISRGDLLILCGFGAGLSWATVLLKY